MANYPYRIPSVANRNQGLPAVLFDVVNLDRVIEADTPINLVDLKRAEAVVEGLKGAQELHPGVTATVIQSAQNRVEVIRTVHAHAEYGIGGDAGGPFQVILNQLAQLSNQINQVRVDVNQVRADVNQVRDDVNQVRDDVNQVRADVNQVRDDVRTIAAMSMNHRIISRNSIVKHPQPLSPLQKVVIGHGAILARQLNPGRVAVNYPAQNALGPAIGAVPPDFNGVLSTYVHADFLNLIVFYNEDFGIVAGDSVATRAAKLRAWLTEV